MYYTTIPLVSERTNNRRWDASKLRELRKRLDSGTMGTEEIDTVATDFLDGEIVDLASDWLGNTVRVGGFDGSFNLTIKAGGPEAFREMFSRTPLFYARTYHTESCYDWNS